MPNDVFAPVLGLYNGMGAHEAHLAREMKLAGRTAVIDPDPYVSRLTGDNPYAALVLCPGDVTLKSGRTNSIQAAKPACNARPNAEASGAVVDRLGR